jgi:acetoin utilization protein AcuB
MQVSDYMSPAPVTIEPGTDYKHAFTIMQDKNLHHLPVLDSSSAIIGIVARRDLQVAAQCFHEAPVEVSEVMHTPVTTVTANESLASAVERMKDQGIGCLPVIDDGDRQLVGIITESDMLRALNELLAKHG